MRPTYLTATSLLLLTLAACAGDATPERLHGEALDALSAGEFGLAVERLERALEGARGTALEAELALELALARVHTDPAKAQAEFDDLAEERPEALDEGDYHELARRLRDAHEAERATEVVHAGLERFGRADAPRLAELLARLQQDAEGDADLREALVGLGYLTQR